MVTAQLKQDIKQALSSFGIEYDDIVLSISVNPKFGDYSSNVSLQLSKLGLLRNYQNLAKFAKLLAQKLEDLDYLKKVEVAGPGFLNFFIKPQNVAKDLDKILRVGQDYGKNHTGVGKKFQVEFISANPTGPLTLANGRGGALGDTLANVLIENGYQVEREFYVNNTGNQVRSLGDSIKAVTGKTKKKEDHYQGEYIKDLAEKFKDDLDLLSLELGEKAADYLMDYEIKPAIKRMGINFDRFYSERSLYQQGLVEKVLTKLKEKGVVYEQDGAIWFKSTDFGDEKDRVLVTSEENRGSSDATYFLADLAHHDQIYKEDFDRRINILGADHHGYEKRIQAGIAALGYQDKLDIIFLQLVKLFKNNQEIRMSKRAGNFVTLDELLDQVSKDVIRFFFLMYSPNGQINFDLDLATKQSNENPVYYVQYAYARMSNILNKQNQGIAQTGELKSSLLVSSEELDLIKHLSSFPDLIMTLSQTYEVHRLTGYALSLAELFHHFYEKSRVLQAKTEDLKQARLGLVKACQLILGKTLKLMGIDAPQRM